MAPKIINLADEYSYLEGFHPEGLWAWGARPLEVRFEVEAVDVDYEREPTVEQLEELRFHLDNQESISSSVLNAFIKEYPRLINFDGDARDQLPDIVATIEEMSALLEFNYIQITSRSGTCGRLLVGFAFESELDPEHGLGCIYDGTSVKNIGGEDQAW
jgi:hypothetical protein